MSRDSGSPQLGLELEPATSAATDTLADNTRVMGLLQQWRAAGWLRPLDLAFAGVILRLCEEQGDPPSPLLLLLSALVSHQVGRGHVCLDLESLCRQPEATLALPPGNHEPDQLSVPAPASVLGNLTPEACRQALMPSAAVSTGSRVTPLVLCDGRLYLYRLWQYECTIAAGIRARLTQVPALADPQSAASRTLGAALSVLFPDTGTTVDYQKVACALAARSRFAIITGGPGTGKTTTVVKLLAALQVLAAQDPARAGRKYRICLAAPTGKAAARLNESIGGRVQQLPLARLPGQIAVEDIPTRVTTLHRLLGSRPDSRRFRHDRDNPLLLDVLVIDEASMVDVDLMASVFAALPPDARLILLGDRDQLASVDAGAVLGELCARAPAGHYRPDTLSWLKAVTGQSLPSDLADTDGQPLDQAVAMLRVSHRFDAGSGIARLATAVNSNRLDDELLRQCRDARLGDVAWINGRNSGADTESTLALVCRHSLSGSPDAFRNRGQGRLEHGREVPPPVGYRHYLTLMRQDQPAADAGRDAWDAHAARVLEAFNAFQILCPLREGPWGVDQLNARIARQLMQTGLIRRCEGWYAGRPVLITGNDYNLGLMNGDIGITFEVPWGEQGEPVLRVAFPAADGSSGIRWISPSRLQQLETVYAMTVHKSQGSEFAHACLVLPDRLSPVLTRELVYTGITRARHWFSLVTGSARILQQAVHQQVVRASGLSVLLATESCNRAPGGDPQ